MNGPKLALITIVGIFYVFVIVSTMPLRMDIIKRHEINDHAKKVEREIYIASQTYQAMLADPNTDPVKLNDQREKLALATWQNRDFINAVQLIQRVVDERAKVKDMSNYDKKWEGSMLNLAGVYRDVNNWAMAKMMYNQILEYDRIFADKKSEYKNKIARDKNNIGLILYLEGQGEQEGPKRTKLMKDAEVELKEAIKLWRETKGPDSISEGNTLWNLYLVQRDLGNWDMAQETKNKAIAIDDKANRKVKAPI